MKSLSIPLLLLILLAPGEASAQPERRQVTDYTECERVFVRRPLKKDPYGYRLTKDINIPGLGGKRRIVECDFDLGTGDRGDRERSGTSGPDDGGRIGRGHLERDRIGRVSGDFSGYIDDQLSKLRELRGGSDEEGEPSEDDDLVPPGLDDADGDGLPDSLECPNGIPCPDSDGDGIPDYLDADDDNDGISTAIECPKVYPCPDSDGDGIPDYLDASGEFVDSDGMPKAGGIPYGDWWDPVHLKRQRWWEWLMLW
jgi:hypothetical protein